MAHEITVYHHTNSLLHGDQAYPLDSFPRVSLQVQDGDDLKTVLRTAVQQIDDDERDPFSHAAWLAFADPTRSTEPSVWRTGHKYWGVSADGRLIADGWNLQHLTIGDLRRGWESGYVDGAWNHVVVLQPEGLGGPGDLVSPFAEFFGNVGMEIAVGFISAPLLRAARGIRQRQRDRRARRVIAGWHRQGIDGPWVLTSWIDTKTTWKPDEVARRLGISRQEAESLLEAVGYEYSQRLHAWTVGTSEKAVKRRKRWDRGVNTEWRRPRSR